MIITWYAIAALTSIIVVLILMCTINYWFAIVLLTWIILQLFISYKTINFITYGQNFSI